MDSEYGSNVAIAFTLFAGDMKILRIVEHQFYNRKIIYGEKRIRKVACME